MVHDKYTFNDVFHKVNKYVRNNMSKHEESLFIKEVGSDKRLGKLVAVICSFIKHSKTYEKAHFNNGSYTRNEQHALCQISYMSSTPTLSYGNQTF